MDKNIKKGKNYYPLTIPQKNIFSAQLSSPFKENDNTALSFCFSIKGKYDVEIIEKAFNRLIYENDGLRLRFIKRPFAPRQYIEDYEYEKLDVISARDWEDGWDKMREYQGKMIIHDRSREKQYRAVIIKHDEGAMLFIRVTHLCIDGFSIGLTVKKLAEYYLVYEKNEIPSEPPKEYSIVNYLNDDNNYVKSETHKEDKEYWKNKFARNISFSFPIRKRKLKSTEGIESFLLANKKYEILKKLSKITYIPVSFYVMSNIAFTVHDLTKKECFAIAPIIHGRMTFSQMNMIGCLNNTILHFYNINDNTDRINFISKNYIEYLNDIKHGRISGAEYISQAIKPIIKNRDPNLFGLLVSTLDFAGLDIDESRFDWGFLPDSSSRLNQLYCSVTDNGKDEVQIYLSYQKEIFSDEDMTEIKECFIQNLDDLVEEAEKYMEEVK